MRTHAYDGDALIASTWFDLVIGVDVHFELVPVPMPCPQPFRSPGLEAAIVDGSAATGVTSSRLSSAVLVG